MNEDNMQPPRSLSCAACGHFTTFYCSGCGITPYCASRCQKSDWVFRHNSTCDNLAISHASILPLRLPHFFNDKRLLSGPIEMPTHLIKYQEFDRRKPRTPSPRNSCKSYIFRLITGENLDLNKNFGSQAETKPVTAAASSAEPEPTPGTSKDKRTSFAFSHQQATKKQPEVAKASTSTASVATPGRKTLPKNYLVETLSIGDVVLLFVHAKASDCRSAANGYICLCSHDNFVADYQLLFMNYSMDCEAAPDCKPQPGELFSYYNPDDGAYYRARCLNQTTAAFVDSCDIVTIDPADKCKCIITPKFEAIPEFCCVLDIANIKIDDIVRCTLESKSAEGYIVQVENAKTGAFMGNGEISRWRPQVDYPVPKAISAATVNAQIPRPGVTTNSTVVLIEASALDRVVVCPIESTRKFDTILEDVFHFGMKATPISEPPQQGQVVIGKFSDGKHYRALCRRASVTRNKYQLEYIEFGNIETNTRETIYECPQHLDLNSNPTVVSLVKLQVNAKDLTAAATEYLENLRDYETELILTLPDGGNSAPSGAEVYLIVDKNKESVNELIELMCAPDWKKIDDQRHYIIDVGPFTMKDLEFLELPYGVNEIEVLDVSKLKSGRITGRRRVPEAKAELEAITREMEVYCNSELGKISYIPDVGELCIARRPPYPQWFRAIICGRVGGVGRSELRLCYIDYGNVETVPVELVRRILPTLVRGRPALAFFLHIQGFPEMPSGDMLERATHHMAISKGCGSVKVIRQVEVELGCYIVDAPELLKAMGL